MHSAGAAGFFANWIVLPLLMIGACSYLVVQAWLAKRDINRLKAFTIFELRGAYEEIAANVLTGSEFAEHIVKYPQHRDALAHALIHKKIGKQ